MFSQYPIEHYLMIPKDFDVAWKEQNKPEIIKSKLDKAVRRKHECEQEIKRYTREIDELNEFIKQYHNELEELKKKVNYFEEVQKSFREKYGSEPYLDTFVDLYNDLIKNKNITIEINKDSKKGYVMIVESGGLNDCEHMKLKLLKDMFNHINTLIHN